METFNSCKICNSDIKIVNEKFNLGECLNCGFIFCLNVFTQQEFIDVYDDLYNTQNNEYQRHSVIEFEKLVNKENIKVGIDRTKLIKNAILKTGCKSVLEIGSGVGLIGTYVTMHKKSIQYTGVELDKVAFEKSRKLGLNTINGDFSIMDTIEQNFDVIMMWEVIEHLQDLKLFLELAHKKLNPNGKIILSTPNYNKIYNYPNRKKDKIFQNEPPIHLNFFTPNSIKKVFELSGFANCTVKVKRFPYFEPKTLEFYRNMIKSTLGKHHGTTLYFFAIKQ